MSTAKRWTDAGPEGTMDCFRCGTSSNRADLDRLLWCDDCRLSARRSATVWGGAIGLGIAAILAIWIWVTIKPTVFVGGWVGACLAAWWLSAKVARELIYGVLRSRGGP